MRNNYLAVIIYIAVIIFGTGCAKTVTPIFPVGRQIVVDVTYGATVDAIACSYYFIFNNVQAPQLPFMPIQFVEPGTISLQPDIDHYTNYYPSWANVVILDGNTLYLIKAPYTSEAVPTREVIAMRNTSQPNKIIFSIPLDKIAPTGNRLFFDFVTVDKTTKLVKDNLSALNSSPSPYYIFTISDSTASASDEPTSTVSYESEDLTDWRILIQ